jgi:hypothetical protein
MEIREERKTTWKSLIVMSKIKMINRKCESSGKTAQREKVNGGKDS